MKLYGLKAVFNREMTGYFTTPVAYVFIVVFLFAIGAFTFYFGNFYQREQADLTSFFTWHPWLYLFFIPAITMRLWAEERKSGTLELLMTLPMPLWQMVLGKFLAAWLFTAITLSLTFPIWITVNYLGSPDNGVIALSYIGSLVMAAAFLSIGSAISSLTKNQVIAFIVSMVVSFLFCVSGFPLVIDAFKSWLPNGIVDLIGSFSFLTNYSEITTGIFEFSSMVFFASLTAMWLYFNTLVLSDRNRL